MNRPSADKIGAAPHDEAMDRPPPHVDLSAEPKLSHHNWFLPEHLRLALRSGATLAPTAVIARGPVFRTPSHGAQIDLDALTLTIDGQCQSASAYLASIHTDGLLVLHRGRVVAERYFEGMTADTPHQWASLTKSITGLLAVLLADAGAIDLSRPTRHYVPELSASPLGSATVQQNLDMELSATWPAELSERDWLMAAGLWPGSTSGPKGVRAFALTFARPSEQPHGSRFFYNNPSAEVVAWACERVMDQRWPRLVSEWIWSKIGAERDAAVLLDPAGDAIASGGMISTLGDLARLAEAVRAGGVVDSQAALPARAIASLTAPAVNADRFAVGNIVGGRAKFGYRNLWYHANDAEGTLLASGRFGQRAIINPQAQLVIAQFSSHPGRSEETAPGFATLVREIGERLGAGRQEGT